MVTGSMSSIETSRKKISRYQGTSFHCSMLW